MSASVNAYWPALVHVNTMSIPKPHRINPKKLLLSKWTALTPLNKEKHFLVTAVVEPEQPDQPVEFVVLEAIISQRSQILPWRELSNAQQWQQGWR